MANNDRPPKKSRHITRELQTIVKNLQAGEGCEQDNDETPLLFSPVSNAIASTMSSSSSNVLNDVTEAPKDIGDAVAYIREKRLTELRCYLRVACMRCGFK